jgi:DNA-binding transcriptional regulator GbsR (MarR family)
MSSRKIDKAATDVGDALEIVEELEDEPDAEKKLDELHDTLDDALDSIEKVKKKDE